MNPRVHVYVYISIPGGVPLASITRSGLAGSKGGQIFDASLLKDSTNLLHPQQCMKVLPFSQSKFLKHVILFKSFCHSDR